ncbi:MAG: hypothetical protein ACFCUQ_04285 [Kiloniellales bacterium]
MPKFDEVPDLLLICAYEHAQTAAFSGEFYEELLISLASDFASPAFVKSAIPVLVRRKHLVQIQISPAIFEITAEGFSHAEKKIFAERERENRGQPGTPGQAGPSFRRFKEDLLIALMQKDQAQGPDIYDLKTIADEIHLDYRPGWIRKAAYDFRDRGQIKDGFSMGGGPDDNLDAQLTAQGLEAAEEILELRGSNNKSDSRSSAWDEAVWDESDWSSESGALLDASGSAFALGSSKLGPVPAADRYVSKSDNQDSWEEAVKALDAVIAEFAKDHPRDNVLGSEKPALLGALKAGRRLLDDTQINVQIGVALLIEPLKVIAARYEKEFVAGLVATAMMAVAKLLGLH